MHEDQEKFIRAIKENKKVSLTYLSDDYNGSVTCQCIPVDYGPPGKEHYYDCYYFWDPEADIGKRLLAIPIWQVLKIELTKETFDAKEFISPERY